MKTKQYLGDFVTAEVEDESILLTYNNGDGAVIGINLYPDTLANLLSWVKELELI